MKHIICHLTLAIIWTLFLSHLNAETERRSPMPERNDVTMRTLRIRDVPPGHPLDVMPALEAFHANRLEWVYLEFTEQEREKIAKIKDRGIIFGGAGSSALRNWIGPEGGQGGGIEIAMIDLEGNPIVTPHKRKWKNPGLMGDPSNPAYLEGHIRYYRKYLEYGADTLQRDEVRGFVSAVRLYGGGFSETGLQGFRDWLDNNLSEKALSALGIDEISTFSYAEYLRERNAPSGDAFADYDGPLVPFWHAYWRDTSEAFFKRMIREVKAGAKRPITFSCNNSSLQVWDPETLEFDFAISELLLGSANPRHIWERSEAARAAGKFQIFGSPKTRGTEVDPQEKVWLTRRVIATAYASGMASRVPWDIFEQTEDGMGRYYGKPEDFADLYAFVSGQNWDGYDRISAQGPDILDQRFPEDAISIEGNDHVYAFLHQDQAGASEPAFLHLVDWGKPLVDPPPLEEMSFVLTAEGDRVYFSENGWENLKRTSPKPFRLVLDMDALDLDPSDKLMLLTPSAYEVSSQGGPFVSKKTLKAREINGNLLVEIESLAPWGIVKIMRE